MSRDTSIWSEKTLKPFVELYGLDNFKEMWASLVDYFLARSEGLTQEAQAELIKKIQAPTLIIHGENDFFVEYVSF